MRLPNKIEHIFINNKKKSTPSSINTYKTYTASSPSIQGEKSSIRFSTPNLICSPFLSSRRFSTPSTLFPLSLSSISIISSTTTQSISSTAYSSTNRKTRHLFCKRLASLIRTRATWKKHSHITCVSSWPSITISGTQGT